MKPLAALLVGATAGFLAGIAWIIWDEERPQPAPDLLHEPMSDFFARVNREA